MFDLLVELVEFSSEHGLPRTAFALEGAIDAFLQDKGLAPQALAAPEPEARMTPGAASPTRAAGVPTRGPLPDRPRHGGADPQAATPEPATMDEGVTGFRSRRVPSVPRRLHLLPSQRVAS